MFKNKLYGIKAQLAAERDIKDAGLLEAADSLYLSFLQKKKDDISEYLLELKANNKRMEFEYFFSNQYVTVLWESPLYNEIIIPIVKYWYKKKFQFGHLQESFLLKKEMPTGLIKFGTHKYEKKHDITAIWHLVEEVIGSFKYRVSNHRFIFTDDGLWYLSDGVKSFIPAELYDQLKDDVVDYIGKEVIFNQDMDIVEEKPAPMQELSDLKNIFNQKNEEDRLDDLDAELLLSNFYVPAVASAKTDEQYPIQHELRIKSKDYTVHSLAFFVGVNALQSDIIKCYYSPTKIYLTSENGSFSIVEVVSIGSTYGNISLDVFRKGMTVREAERLEKPTPPTIKVPDDLIKRKPILKDILDRQRLIKDNIYENIVELMQEYISSYTEKVKSKIKIGGQIREYLMGKLSTQNESDLNYVYEVDEIFWKYNPEISPEELLAFFITKGNDETYRLLCLKILGIDYMYHYNELLDALIERRLIMIEHIEVDADKRTLKNLQYNYLHTYASGDIYKKLEALEENKPHIKYYFGDETGQKIIDAQTEILNDMVPTPCTIISSDRDRHLELDFSNSIFWQEDFPELQVRGSRDKKPIRLLFEDYIINQEKLGGITNDMIINGYMYPLTRTEFIKKFILNFNGKPVWKHDGKLVDIKTPSLLDILDAIYKNPAVKDKQKQKKKDFTHEKIKVGKEVQKAIITKYYYTISVIKKEGNRLFNMFLRNELTAASQEIIQNIWNKKFNSYKAPVSDKVPIFIRLARYFGNKNELFELNEAQLSAVHFTVARYNCSLIAAEVGLGKTIGALAVISHLFETNTASRIMILTPKRVYRKFIREAFGDPKANFRGVVPHINLVEIDNAKPDKFEPRRNYKTKEIIGYKLKKYTAQEMEVYDSYKAFLIEIKNIMERLPNRIFPADTKSIDIITDTLKKYIPNYTKYSFLTDMIKRIEINLQFYLDKISEKISQRMKKLQKDNLTITAEEIEYYSEDFSRDTFNEKGTGELNSMKNKILDELGYYFPEYLKPKTIVMATYIALEELRPDEQAVRKVIRISDDAKDNIDIRYSSKQIWKNISNQAISFDKLNIDGIIIDEAHNFNEIFNFIRPRYIRRKGIDFKYSKLPIGHRDSIGRHLFRYWYTIGQTDERKMTAFALTQQVKSRIMLSATPFTEGPLHAYSIMNLVNRQLLEEMNFGSSYDFFDNFIFEIWKIDTKYEKTGLFASVDRYRNNAALCNFMSAFAEFRIGGEEMKSVRPEKYIIPDEENRIGNIKSFIPHNAAQEWIKNKISDFINGKIDDICEEEEEETFIVYDKNDKNFPQWEATEKEIIDYIETKKDKIPNYNPDRWQDNLSKLGLSIKKDTDIDEDKAHHEINTLIKGKNADARFLKEARVWRAASMQAKMNISPYFVDCKLPPDLLPPLEEIHMDRQGNPILLDGKPISKRSVNFVHNSPKIYYTIECIKSVLDYHRTKGQELSGQIIYMNIGKSFKYGGITYSDSGRSPLGSAFTLIKRYIVYHRPDIGLSEDEVAIVHAGIKDSDVDEIMDKFQKGQIKVLIASSSIREGIDLQNNATVMYLLQAEFNPTNAIQLEGRIWRQGNRWKNVRIVYVLSYNSNDIFVYSKVKNKINSIRAIMRAGKCDLNETQIFSLDAEEVQQQLNTNSEEKAKIWWQGEESRIRASLSRLDMEKTHLKIINKEYPKVKELYQKFLGQLNILSRVIEQVKLRDLRDNIVHDLRKTDKVKLRSALEEEADRLISEGKYQKIYTHIDLTENMSNTLFQERLNYIRTNYRIAEDYRKHRDKDAIRQHSIEFGDKTKQEIYWEAIIQAGFENYSEFRDVSASFSRGTKNDTILSLFNSQVLGRGKSYADIEDIIEEIEKEINDLKKRINQKDKEIIKKQKEFDADMERKRAEGAFSVDSQIELFATTNHLIELKND